MKIMRPVAQMKLDQAAEAKGDSNDTIGIPKDDGAKGGRGGGDGAAGIKGSDFDDTAAAKGTDRPTSGGSKAATAKPNSPRGAKGAK